MMEYWDLYDYNGKKKEKIAIRGNKLNNDEFHLVVNAWIVNDQGEFLITQRNEYKSHPLMWECTGGSALIGETSLQAAVREIGEELGIDINKDEAIFVGETRRFYENCPDILQVWLFKSNVSIKDVVIQEEEVNDVMWASREKIIELLNDNKFEANVFFNKVINLKENEMKYYIDFNNKIDNDSFIDGTITINPNKKKENIYYTKDKVIDKTDESFLNDYKNFLINSMKNVSSNYKNISFLTLDKEVYDLVKDEKFSLLGIKDYELINKLNDNGYVRKLLDRKIDMLNYKFIDKRIDFDKAREMVNSNSIIIEDKENNLYYVDNEDKFNEITSMCDNYYSLSEYREGLPINVSLVIGDNKDIVFPTSVQLVELNNDKFKYVGSDFIYSQHFKNKITDKIKEYTSIIADELRREGYRGVIGFDFVIDLDDQIYFTGINIEFPKSSFIINKYLSKYCFTSIVELHYLAVTYGYLFDLYLDKIDNSFLCYDKNNDYSDFEYSKKINNKKVFNYSILKHGNFLKRSKDL